MADMCHSKMVDLGTVLKYSVGTSQEEDHQSMRVWRTAPTPKRDSRVK